ncbi:MAG: hypothetical protein OEM64_07450 [Gammaproteobacteria bacterium]|nr:hypothetical protein [Gammaproteobacteria bacterium]MDH3416124.1 hypothetical protein [Gammaproteobacteria bacterium]
MARILFFISLILFNTSVIADANHGEYLGYTLGDKYRVPRGTVGEYHITGAMIYAVDPKRQAHHVDSMSIYVSPKSSIIGSIFGEWYFSNARSAKSFADNYLAALEKKYPHWKLRGRSLTYGDHQLWVDLEEKPPFDDYWPSRDKHRVAIGLIYAPDSLGRNNWMALIDREVNNFKLSAKK